MSEVLSDDRSISSATSPAIDVAAERARTPGVFGARHLNAAGAALPTSTVLEAVVEHLDLESRIGGYEAAAAARERLDAVYDQAARLIGGQRDDIALVESATVGWQRMIDALQLGPGDRILAARSSYVSSALNLLELERTRGIELEVLPRDAAGHVDVAALERALERPAALVTIAQIPTSSGLLEPAAEVGRLARAAGVPYLLDATQSVGHLPVDVREIGCDALFTTGRKFLRGPRGTGFLYVDAELRGRIRPPAPDVRGARWSGEHAFELSDTALRFETWETSHALRLGLGVAIAEARALGVDAVAAHVTRLGQALRERLTQLPGVTVTDPAGAVGGIVTFVRDGEDPRATQQALQELGVHVVPVPAGHGQWDMAPRRLEAVVRASFHVYNDVDDIDALERVLRGGGSRNGRAPLVPPATPGAQPPDAAGTAGATTTTAPARAPFRGGVQRVDVVVVGAGIHGSAAAWQLARRGLRVLALERLRGGHLEGSSHGRTRMIRRAYPSAAWDGLVDRAFGAWDELADAAGRPLVTTVGGLFARPAGGPGGLRGPGCAAVDPEQAAAIFPALRLDEGFEAVHDPQAGIIDVPEALAALGALGARAGVERRDASPVVAWAPDGEGVAVHTPAGRVLAERLVICAGPWTGALVPELAPALRVIRIVNAHFGSSAPDVVTAPALGAFSVDVPDVGLLYGFGAFGGRGVKVGLDDGPPDDLDRPREPVSADEVELLRGLLRRFLPAVDGDCQEALSCRYTMAPRNRFAVGALPDRPQVLVAAACSGHGFKFGPAIGAALADLATGEERPDLAFLDPALMLDRQFGAAG